MSSFFQGQFLHSLIRSVDLYTFHCLYEISIILRSGCCKRRYAALRATLLCDASGARVDALVSHLFEPEKAVAFSPFSTNFTFFSIKDCDKFSDGGAFNASIWKKIKKNPSWRFLQHPDLNALGPCSLLRYYSVAIILTSCTKMVICDFPCQYRGLNFHRCCSTSWRMVPIYLTHLSLAFFLWDIGKQNSPRRDAAERGVPSGAILFASRNFIEKLDKKIKITPNTPKNESGLPQMIMMGKSTRQIWVKEWISVALKLSQIFKHATTTCFNQNNL